MKKYPIIFVSGGGFLFWKGITIINNLEIDKKNYYFLGVSAGNLINVLYLCNIKPEDVLNYSISIYDKYSSIFNIYNGIRDLLNYILPNNAHEICTGHLFIATYSFPNDTKIVSYFKTRNDLINEIVTSVSFPISLNNLFKGQWDHIKDTIHILNTNIYDVNYIYLHGKQWSLHAVQYPTIENAKKLFENGKKIKIKVKQSKNPIKKNVTLFKRYTNYINHLQNQN